MFAVVVVVVGLNKKIFGTLLLLLLFLRVVGLD